MANDKVTQFPGTKPDIIGGPPNDSLIKALEDALEMAKSGRLQSFIGTGHTSDGMRFAFWADHNPDVYQVLGSIAWLEHEYVARHTGGVVP